MQPVSTCGLRKRRISLGVVGTLLGLLRQGLRDLLRRYAPAWQAFHDLVHCPHHLVPVQVVCEAICEQEEEITCLYLELVLLAICGRVEGDAAVFEQCLGNTRELIRAVPSVGLLAGGLQDLHAPGSEPQVHEATVAQVGNMHGLALQGQDQRGAGAIGPGPHLRGREGGRGAGLPRRQAVDFPCGQAHEVVRVGSRIHPVLRELLHLPHAVRHSRRLAAVKEGVLAAA
mmetsp:Transcript_132132/g.313206  ORF Transcript_132132/g.313206 Transcript_132132/m.313206 type:complete len:229 (-) Transcript_132132:298-984(-)